MAAPSPTASFSEGHSTSSVDMKKKRKLQDESGDLYMSSPKQRFRVGSNIFSHGLVIRGGFLEEPIVGGEIQPEESDKDSNNFIGASYDSSTSSDSKDSNENSITLTIIDQNQPSTSLNSCSNEVLKTHLCSLGSGVMKEVNNVVSADSEDEEETTETMILYSNDAAPHSFILSSGRWNLGEGAPLGAKRLTIDQEFEQYFSSLLI